ncbi:unnamed protein product [Clonostachys chloroleuca]|uniref:Uncharacterized protein n=1 Tax=Clonostachys chloroleuca TaxID=1926264 RepID=A0AA35VLC3_9HYPO|nr:unnamed protein product [Clonostachys chloroleuca]
MSASTCVVCHHLYEEHNAYPCKGQDKQKKDGKKKWVKCKNKWYICQQIHETERRNAYVVCHNCPSHPGGGPEGSEPGGSFDVAANVQKYQGDWEYDHKTGRYFYTDEQGEIHWYNESAQQTSNYSGVGGGASTHAGQSSSMSQPATLHQRNDSRDEPDPLSWDEQRIAAEVANLDIAEERGEELDRHKVSARYTKGGKVRFTDILNRTLDTDATLWFPSEDGYTCEINGVVYFTKKIKPRK